MYIYFDTNGTIKEVINDESIRKGSSDYNKIYCYLEGNPDIDDIWYLQKNPDGTLTNEVSFVDNIVTKAIPYDAKRDMKYFQDFVEYQFYTFTLTSSYLSQNGLVVATIRVAENNTMWALGELTFNVQANIVNYDNEITQSQYDYLLLSYASRTLNEQTGSELDNLLDEKIEAKANDIIEPIFNDYKETIDEEVENQNETIASLIQASPRVFDTASNITALTENKGVAVATDTGYIYYWNNGAYVSSGLQYSGDLTDYVKHDGNQLKDNNGNNIYPNLDDGQVNYSNLDTKLEESLNLIFNDTSISEFQKDSGYKYIYNSQYNIFGESTNQWSDAIVYQVEKGKIYKLKSFQRANTLIYGFCANIPTTSQPYTPLNSNYLYGGEESTTKEYILKAPENCYLLVTVVNNSTTHGLYELDKIRSKIENVDLKDITTAKSVQETIHIGLSTDTYNDYIYKDTGTTDSSSTTYKSKDTEIIKNAIEIKITKTIGVYGGAFLDENKNWISSFSASTLGTTYTIPSNAKYVNLTINITSTGNGFDFITQRYEIVNLYVPFDENSIMPSQWYGKKIVCIGTSVSFGSNATESYIHYASQKMGFNLINASVPGQAIQTDNDGTSMTYGSTTLSISEYASEGITIADTPLPYVAGGNYNNYYRTWEHIFDIQDVDLYVFDVVPNNTNFDMTDWNGFNRNTWTYNTGTFADHRKTFLGALLYLLDKMYTANPKARIVLVISSTFQYLNGKSAFETIANSYNIPIINLWGKVTTTPPSLQVLKSLGGNDNHPSTFAHECMGKMFVGELLKIA